MTPIKLIVRHKVPSLNRLFAMNPWTRKKEKEQTQAAFMSALQASGADSSTLTTFARSISLIAAGMSGGSKMIGKKISRSKFAKSKSKRAKRKGRR